MATLEDLLNDLANLDAQHDLDGMRRVREQIVQDHGESDAAAEAQYKLGLDFLFRQRNVMTAIEAFTAASKRKHPYWSNAARTSLALCYYHQDKKQKAMFELRKVALPETPNIHSVNALTFIERIFQDEGNKEEVQRARRERIGQLGKLVETNEAANGDAAERGYFLYLLGLALIDDEQRPAGREALEKAKALGPAALGDDLHRSVIEALR